MLGVSWYQSAQLFAGNRLTVGFDYFHFGGESWNRFLDGHEEPQVDKTQDEVAGYVDFRQSLGTWLTLDAGLRVDRHSHVGTEWVPQAGVSFHLPRSAEIKLSAGKGFRYPTIRELYMFRPANPDLRPERLWSYELSLSQRLWEGRLSYGVNLFYIDGENLILRMPVDGRQMNVNTGRIENAGVEAEIAYRISAAWSVDANYSFLHMEHPRAGRSRTQTPRRSLLHAGPLVGLDGPAIRGGSLHFDRRRRDGQRRTGKFHPVEPARRFPHLAQIAYLRRRREPAGAAL